MKKFSISSTKLQETLANVSNSISEKSTEASGPMVRLANLSCDEVSNREINHLVAVILGELLTDTTALLEVERTLKSEMIPDPDQRFIYDAICSVDDRGEEVNITSVDCEMSRMDSAHRKKIGGVSGLTKYLAQPMHTGSGRQYAEDIKRMYMTRQCHETFAKLQCKASDTMNADPLLLMDEAEQALTALRGTDTMGSVMQQIGDVADEVIQQERECLEKGVDSRRVLTGIKYLDNLIGGFYNGELIVEAGRPGDGKTALAMFFAMDAATRQGKTVCFFSLEMSKDQTLRRYFARGGTVDASRLRVNGPSEEDIMSMEAQVKELHDLPFYFCYKPDMSAAEICAQVRMQRRQGKCDLVVIDYLQLVRKDRVKGVTTSEATGRVVQAFKNLAQKEHIPVLLISQMNRLGEATNEPYGLHNLRDSGEIEQVADCVFFVSIPRKSGLEVFPDTKDRTENVGMIDVQKSRNSPIGIIRYRFKKDYTCIYEYEKGATVS